MPIGQTPGCLSKRVIVYKAVSHKSSQSIGMDSFSKNPMSHSSQSRAYKVTEANLKEIGAGLLCLYFNHFFFPAFLFISTYYAQNFAWSSTISCLKFSSNVNALIVLLEYIDPILIQCLKVYRSFSICLVIFGRSKTFQPRLKIYR